MVARNPPVPMGSVGGRARTAREARRPADFLPWASAQRRIFLPLSRAGFHGFDNPVMLSSTVDVSLSPVFVGGERVDGSEDGEWDGERDADSKDGERDADGEDGDCTILLGL